MTTRKAHFVAKGFTQIPGVDFFESYTSVICYESLCMNLTITVANDMEAWQIDYIAAYLNSLPQAKVYIKLRDGSIAKLLCSLYGTMDGAYNWWDALDKDMADLGYYCSKANLLSIPTMQTEKSPSPAHIPTTPPESPHQRRKLIGQRRSWGGHTR